MRQAANIIGGARRIGGERRSVTIYSPSTGDALGTMFCATETDVDDAVVAAADASEQLAAMTVRRRAGLLVDVADIIDGRAEEIAEMLADEQGKPITEARGEVVAASAMWRETAEIVRHMGDEILPSENPEWTIFVVRRPHGVVAAITPWNFPFSIPTEYLAAGLAMGNALVWKPSELTPLISEIMVQCIEAAGFPQGSVNVVQGFGAEVGAYLSSHRGVDAVGFTGSPRGGDAVARSAGPKPILLELGGNNATVVLKDADIEQTARLMLDASYSNAGQICASTERIFVEQVIYDDLVGALGQAVRELKLGMPRDESTTIGPLNNEATAEKMDRHIGDAVTKGASVVLGGKRADGFPTDLFYEPTVLSGLTPEMFAYSEETFGPMVALAPFDDDDEVVRLVNDHRLGLVAGIMGEDLDRTMAIGRRFKAGLINIGQTATNWQPHTPFGGYSGRASGVGRLGGKYTLESLSQLQTFVLPAKHLP